MPFRNSGRPHPFTFYGRVEPDTVVGERVVVRVPLASPVLNALSGVTLRDFIEHVEDQYVALQRQYGSDCQDFQLLFDERAGGVAKVIFTRPMDRVEITQIRVYRGQMPSPPGDEAPTPPRSLPDPSAHALDQQQ